MKDFVVRNLQSNSGNYIPNQFEIVTPKGVYFQSYDKIIAYEDMIGRIYLDSFYWNYSSTTSKYLYIFLGVTRKEFKDNMKYGSYKFKNLNND